MIDYGKPFPRPWSKSDEARLTELWKDDHSDEFIAEDLGRSVRAVAIRRQKLGLVTHEVGNAGDVRSLSDWTLIRELRRRGFIVTKPCETRMSDADALAIHPRANMVL